MESFSIFNSQWFSHVHVVSKKFDFIMVEKENNELV